MNTRIAVVAEDTKLLEAVQKAATGAKALVTPLAAGAAAPPATAAVMASGKHLSAALEAVLSVGHEQAGLLMLIADAVSCREGIPAGSAERLGAHTVRFAQALDLTPEDQLTLERAAYLHDIGKIMISNDILLKKSVLDYDEWSLLQGHSRLGADLLRERNVCTDVVDIVLSHHECYDGDGYPDHLEKDAIPYLARIMKILDVYCSMTSYRHYRATQATHESAIEHLLGERGKHYDPDLVDVFVNAKVGQTPAA